MRRKKCDELRPNCANCERLGIRCSRYGKKPDYMDGGLKEKKKAEEVKNAIKAANLYKRLPHPSDTGKTAQYTIYETPLLVSPLQDNNIILERPVVTSALDHMSAWNLSYPSTIESTKLIQPDQINKSTTITTDLPPPPHCNQNSFESDKSFRSPSMNFNDNLSPNNFFARLETTDWPSTEMQPGYSLDAMLDLTLPTATLIPTPPKENLEFKEAILLIHYMDHVLYIQFPFYNDSLSHHGRGWLLSLLTRVKPICMCIFVVKNFLIITGT